MYEIRRRKLASVNLKTGIVRYHCITIQALPFFCKTENSFFTLTSKANPKMVMVVETYTYKGP